MPSLLDQPVALRSGDPPRLSRISKTSSIGLSAQDHSGKEFNPVRCLLCGGSCHGQSGSVFSRWAISSRWVNKTIPANKGNTSGNASGYRRQVEESTIETSKSREEIIRQTPTFYALKLHSNQTLLVKYRGEGRPSHQEKGCWLSKPPPFLMPTFY